MIGIAGAMILLLAGLAGSATAATEPEYSLSASPDAISWPDAPKFQYRLQVKAGDEPLDVSLAFPAADWGYGSRVNGTMFSTANARLDGPGELAIGDMPAVPMPLPGSCSRGPQPWVSAVNYRLTLPAGEQTTVVADSRLAAAPLAATSREIQALVWGDDTEQVTLNAPLAIDGLSGVLIESGFVGSADQYWVNRRIGQGFRLTGTTDPPLADTRIRITAHWEDRLGGEPRGIQTVRTDEAGRFTTGPLSLYEKGTWSLRASLVAPGELDNAPQCAGAVNVGPAAPGDLSAALNGHTFRSIRVRGRAIGRKQISLKFFLHARHPNQPERPTLVASAGCNSMGARYRAVNGRLRWQGSVMSTMIGCPPARLRNDRWLQRNLRKGMKARLKGKRLTLVRGKTRIVLRQTR